MTLLERLRLRTTDNGVTPGDDVLNDCLESAKNAILARRYPCGDWPEREVIVTIDGDETTVTETYVEDRYLDLQFRIALDLYNKIGAEGETQHIENGIHRNYGAQWISSDLLREITPYCGVVK